MGSYTLKSTIPDIIKSLDDGAREVVRETAREVETHAKLAMQQPKSGRVYTRGGKPHTASAPGEAPAIDTSSLINAIQVEDEAGATSYVNVYVLHGLLLELGTRLMAPRPFLGPAMEKARASFARRLSALYEGASVSLTSAVDETPPTDRFYL